MKKNVGGIDRGIRLILALVILLLGLIFQSWWGLLGLIPLFTAIINWCPAYSFLGISTCKIEKEVRN